jgi:cellulose biosynthesis protein BcsQ
VSRIQDALRRAEAIGRRRNQEPEGVRRRHRVLCVASNKGGVGKTTIATNLAVAIRALREDLPILVLAVDDQASIDRIFAFERCRAERTTATVLRSGCLRPAVRPGRHGVHYVPTSPDVSELKCELDDPFVLQHILLGADWPGLVIIDTKSDLEILTQNAIAASDLTLVPVVDQASLIEAGRVYELLERWQVPSPSERARLLLSMVDRRVEFRGERAGSVPLPLVAEIRRRGHPLCETYLSRSPEVEALSANPEGLVQPVVHAAGSSQTAAQLRQLAQEVLENLFPEGLPAARGAEEPPLVLLEGLTPQAADALPCAPLRVEKFPFRIGRADAAVTNDLSIIDQVPWQVSRSHLALVESGGRVGVVDTGSRLGGYIDGKHFGGASGSAGPFFFQGHESRLVIGSRSSPFRFRVEVRGARDAAVHPRSRARHEWLRPVMERLQVVASLVL